MPILKPKSPPPRSWRLVFGSAAGKSSKDFYVLAYNPVLDELENKRNSSHEEYTHILYFKDSKRSLVGTSKQRIDEIWISPTGHAYAVGSASGVIEASPTSCSEVSLDNLPGVLNAIWGVNDEHIFACGVYSPFMLYRQHGVWQEIALPNDTPQLRAISGLDEHNVYIVGDNGYILYFDGQSVQKLDSPTTRHFTSVVALNDSHLCIGGYFGILLFGNKKGWRIVPSKTEEPLLNLAHFKNEVCYCSPDGVWSFDGINSPKLLLEQTGRWVNSLHDSIMIVDGYDAWLFDGAILTSLDTQLLDDEL
jgi:hypothetical protein